MSEWFKEKRPAEPKRLTRRHLSAVQRSVICNMQHSVLRSTARGLLMDCGFEAGVATVTFYALLKKGLLRLKSRAGGVRVYKLSAKGERWARLSWENT